MKRIALYVLLFFALPISGFAQLCFSPVDSFAVGTDPLSIISADFNGDGFKDLATANEGSGDVSILLGTGTGSFGAATNFAAGGTTPDPYSVCSADFNGDGKADLAVGHRSSNSVSVLLGTGTGSFLAADTFAVGIWAYSVCSADFNGDGNADLAMAHYGNETTNTSFVLLGTGTGSFGAAIGFTVGSSSASIISADFNGDGKADLATADAGCCMTGGINAVSVLLGTGTGSFPSYNSFGTHYQPYSVISADFNGDGKADLATANGDVSVLLGSGTGSFGTVTNYTTSNSSRAVCSADFNGDGKLDLATANSNSSNVSILLGTGSGSFGAATNFALCGTGPLPYSICSADFNGDGKPDLATANNFSNKVSVLLNCTVMGIEQFTNNNEQVSIYPNPTNTIINLSISQFDNTNTNNVAIYNTIGNCVHRQIITSSNCQIDVSDLNAGVYFISIETEKGRTIKKIIKN